MAVRLSNTAYSDVSDTSIVCPDQSWGIARQEIRVYVVKERPERFLAYLAVMGEPNTWLRSMSMDQQRRGRRTTLARCAVGSPSALHQLLFEEGILAIDILEKVHLSVLHNGGS